MELPKEELGLNKISLNTVVKMEQYFSVSRLALLNRLMFIDLINKAKKEEYRKPGVIKKSALLMGYNDELYESGNDNRVIGDYGERAKKLYDKEEVSETDFYGLMHDIGIDLDKNIQEDGKAAG